MRRLLLILGIVLMVVAFLIMAIFIVAPAVVPSLDEATFLRNILQTFVCHPDETLTADYSTYNTPTSTTRSVYMACMDRAEHSRDVEGQIILIGTVGFVVPFIVGLFITIAIPSSSTKRYSTPAAFVGANDSARRVDMFFSAHGNSQAGHIPLAQRLQELKDAHNQGLITEAEYQAKREELLNNS